MKETTNNNNTNNDNNDSTSIAVSAVDEKALVDKLDDNDIEDRLEKDFERSLRQFGIGDKGIDIFKQGDGSLFTRNDPTREEIERNKQMIDRQGDLFAKAIEMEETIETLQQEISSLKKQLADKDKMIASLQLKK
ncbi:putative RNaseIII [Cavenderia fasciculata]|uniref:RNaseIII n=1 Tax=Cavenderia fasciculata TaxID=261658 RepID=F4PSJ5_CACFS|nr:putative RNaseIII [Cavenderia fasciculata]EGG21525.1 putative RNaseIII [Cavenderia fasciculata]|eukprot:XP_004359375.1 putative RNaseIII [Cavenderia fasciculata]